MKPVLVTSGEPAGIGPDLCLSLAQSPVPLVVLGDRALLASRARQLGLDVHFDEYHPGATVRVQPNHLTVFSIPCAQTPVAGRLDVANAPYVEQMLTMAEHRCRQDEFCALVTAPVHKGIMNQAGLSFTGHTEFFAQASNTPCVVMMLVSSLMRVALVTTHLPLKAVSAAITPAVLTDVIRILHRSLQRDFNIEHPIIRVAGLNPHAGEGGYLGREEIDVIEPVLKQLAQEGLHVTGPYPADTLFVDAQRAACDVFLVMYHDQGLPVIKYADFHSAVNVTLGLPYIRTSVDHGTALDLAGQGVADSRSLWAAVTLASDMSVRRGAITHDTN